MESFFLAETTKYLYLLFDTDNFIHNEGQQGTLVDTVNGKCVIESGGYIFNTEAHPIDLAALHCCHDVPKMQLFDFADLHSKKSLFKGETLDDIVSERKAKVENNSQNHTVANDSAENDEIVNNTSTVSETNSSLSSFNETVVDEKLKLTSSDGTENKTESLNTAHSFMKHILGDRSKQFDPQEMLERIRMKKKYMKTHIPENNYKLLSCKSQSFIQKISILGEFFNT